MSSFVDALRTDLSHHHAGWAVDIRLVGAEVVAVHRAGRDVVTLKHPACPDNFIHLDLGSGFLDICQADPSGWPVQAGDIWLHVPTGTHWFAYLSRADLPPGDEARWAARDSRGNSVTGEDLLDLGGKLRDQYDSRGPWKLVHREERS